MARNTRTFTDLDFNFMVHPRTGDVSTRSDEEAVKKSIEEAHKVVCSIPYDKQQDLDPPASTIMSKICWSCGLVGFVLNNSELFDWAR